MTAATDKKADLNCSDTLWKSADTLLGHIDAVEYRHLVLGLLFLKYISDSFEARKDEFKAELEAYAITGPQLQVASGRGAAWA